MASDDRTVSSSMIIEACKHIVDIRTGVFHNIDSSCLLGVPTDFWQGVGKNPSKHGYIPCKLCYGVTAAVDRQKIAGKKATKQYESEKRLIDGNYVASSKIIGHCHSLIHRGYLTKNLIKSHDCIGKKCSSFEKIKPDYWQSLITAENASKEKRAKIKVEKKHTSDRDVFIKATLEDSGSIYVTAIREGSRNYLDISYIYDRYIDLSQEVKFLRKELGKNIRLKAVTGTEEAIEKLIRKPRRDMGKGTDVRKAPKIGNAAKARLHMLGVYCLEDLFNRNGDALYKLDCYKSGKVIDRRYLTAYRSAVEYANHLYQH